MNVGHLGLMVIVSHDSRRSLSPHRRSSRSTPQMGVGEGGAEE